MLFSAQNWELPPFPPRTGLQGQASSLLRELASWHLLLPLARAKRIWHAAWGSVLAARANTRPLSRMPAHASLPAPQPRLPLRGMSPLRGTCCCLRKGASRSALGSSWLHVPPRRGWGRGEECTDCTFAFLPADAQAADVCSELFARMPTIH